MKSRIWLSGITVGAFVSPIHDVADRQGGAGLDLFQAHGRGADEQQVVDERLPDLARPLPVCPPAKCIGI